MKTDFERYVTGEDIRVGDHVSFGGHEAIVVAVIGRGQFAPGFTADDWADYNQGFVMRVADGQLYMYELADEDIHLLARHENGEKAGSLPKR